MPDLQAYLDRIGYRGTPAVDLATLRELHRRHLRAIAYENLDVQRGVPVSLDVDAVFHKLVRARRGGWCYEMNGLLAWALEEIGFSLTRLAAGVMREVRGDAALGNHLALWVHGPLDGVEQGWLADVGFGDGVLEPVALRPGPLRQGRFEFALETLADGWWRFHNHPDGGARSFDFVLQPADPELLDRQCRFLQTSPESPFTQVAVVQRHVPDGLVLLRGRVLSRISGGNVAKREVADSDEYQAVLRNLFDLDVPDIGELWQKVERQHATYLRDAGGCIPAGLAGPGLSSRADA